MKALIEAASDSATSSSGGSHSRHEPIAIIGMGCRFPGGAGDSGSFWKLLCDGVDAIREVPPDRFDLGSFYDPEPGQRGMMNVRYGGFIEGIDQFDPEFFGLSQREAASMDPQQRLLLEVAWEALEDGAEVIQEGANTGVFVGISTTDYQSLQVALSDRSFAHLHSTVGNAASIAANRISYCLNLHGPSMALDSACSSSLTAVHLACRSLRDGECHTALAGGVNALLNPLLFISFESMLSPDGRCKAFDSRANGFVRAEGAGMVLLKPLGRALADGNPIYAVIRGSAANQDGRTSGITVPSQEAQEALVAQACLAAGVPPGEVHYVEAHGTGTPVGDPIEARALSAVLGAGHRNGGGPLLLGSVKTNIGHLEAGAGVAGLIKLALMLRHRLVPPSLHLIEPNPEIDFERLGLRVVRDLESLPAGRVIAGINSFGFGGANAHAVLESPPELPDSGVPRAAKAQLLALSAQDEEVLPSVARRYAAWFAANLDQSSEWLGDVCYTAALRRVRHEHRLTLVANSPAAFAEKLEAFASGELRPGVSAGHGAQARKLAFVCSGQGPQWWGMGRQLLTEEPVFRRKIEECDALLRTWSDWSLVEELSADESRSRMHEPAIAQPAIFSLQVALAALWSSWGIEPEAVVGHSVGEVAAAHLSGALDLEQAARVIFHRGRCAALAPATGRMLAAAMAESEAIGLLDSFAGRVCLGAVNSPHSVTFSGEAESLVQLERTLNTREIHTRFLRVSYAFHSPDMDVAREDLLDSLKDVDSRPPRIPLISTVTGASTDGSSLDADYWWHNFRHAVRFSDAMAALAREGCSDFLEISPHPVLGGAVLECLPSRNRKPLVLASLRRGEDERDTMLAALGALHAAGYPVDWKELFPEGRCVRLPAYPWNHRRFWQEVEEIRRLRLGAIVHPLLGRKTGSAHPSWENKLLGRQRPLLKDHRVQGRIVFPAAAYVEMALSTGRELYSKDACRLEEIEFRKPLFVPEDGETPSLQLIFDPAESGFQILSRANDSQDFWTLHCAGRLKPAEEERPVTDDPAAIRERCGENLPGSELYPRLVNSGFQYGPRFRGIQRLWRGRNEALGWIEPPASPEDRQWQMPPQLLDSCFTVLLAAVAPAVADVSAALYLPARIGEVRFHARPAAGLWCHGRLKIQHPGGLEADLRLINPDGRVAVEIIDFVCLAVEGSRRAAEQTLEEALYEFQWQLKPLDSAAMQPPPDYLPDVQPLARRLQEAAQRRASGEDAAKFRQLEKDTDRLCAGYVANAFSELGFAMRPGGQLSTERLHSVVARQHQAVLRGYLKMLETDGLLIPAEGGWTATVTPRLEDTAVLWRSIFARLPGYLPELLLLRHCGLQLAEMLRGLVDPVATLFAGDSFAERFFADSLCFRSCYGNVQKIIEAVVGKLPEGRRLRILEVGAGTGGLTASVLQVLDLPPEQIDYVFTDLSGSFLARAEQRFQQHPFMRYQTLDLERSAIEQGFAGRSFDLVLAANVVHATSDVRRSLGRLEELLAPRGLLLMVEIEHPARWLDITFAPTRGWWSFTDTDLREGSPLLNGERWLRVLGEKGFADAAAVTDAGGLRDNRHVVLMARGPDRENTKGFPQAIRSRGSTTARWLLFADAHGVGSELADSLAARGDQCVVVNPGGDYRAAPDGKEFEVRPGNKDDMVRLLAAAGRTDGVLILWSVDSPEGPEPSLAELDEAQRLGCHSVLALVQALSAMNPPPRLWLITRGAQPAGRERRINVSHAALWGLGRVVVNEHPQLQCRMIDLAMSGCEEERRALLDELRADVDDQEVALRGEARYVLRVVRSAAASRGVAGARGPFRVQIAKPGVVDELALRPIERRVPGPGEVEVEVQATALNFRDLMKVIGIYPRESPDYLDLGGECGGCVAAVGDGVTDFEIGDRVLVCPASHGFASHVICAVKDVTHCPPALCMEEAVTVPAAFKTAAYALRSLARIKAGERVLIHSAAGAVGLAAVQIALTTGCEVFATAGTGQKREFLRALGVHHVMDSHTLAFAEEVMRITRREGVDVVLNSLAGEALVRSLSLLRHRGRFLEIGKRDIYGNSRIGLRPFRTNIGFFSVEFFLANEHQPDVIRELWERIRSEIEDGRLHPLPVRLFPMKDVAGAFNFMMRGEHIGKIVLTVSGNEPAVQPLPPAGRVRFHDNATYLITGGLGGFGLATARWMAEHGACHLVLVGRSGASSPGAVEALEELRQNAVHVVVAKADISVEAEVARVLDEIRRDLPPLRGVLHAAMVLDDGIVSQLDSQRFDKVMAPKVRGAWNLHGQTRGERLDFFVMFSSMASVIGNSGQANYAAANAFLDSLAHYRRGIGLPALTVNWGALKEVGYVAQRAGLAESIARLGVVPLNVRPALALLGRLLESPCTQLGVIEADWNRWARSMGAVSVPHRFSILVTQTGEDAGEITEGKALRAAILAADDAGRKDLMESFLRSQAARVLRSAAASLDLSKPLNSLGLDSLMAVELMNRIENELGLAVPSGKLLGGQTLSDLATALLKLIDPSSHPTPSPG